MNGYGQRGEVPAGRAHGQVVNFSKEKRYGFIRPYGTNGNDVFVHASAVKGGFELVKGDHVEFDMVDRGQSKKTPRRLYRADNVVRIGGA